MASSSKKYHRRRSTSKSRSKKCNGGRRGRRGQRTNDKKKTHKWHQKGCQSGGGSMTGGWPWAPSDVHHQTAGTGAEVPQSINGNHFALNTDRMTPPQSSNHLVEKGMFGGRRKKSSNKGRRSRRHRRFIGEQHGGMAQYLPETANTTLRGVTETPAMIANTLQGASTGFVSSNPTIQPIGEPIQLK